MVGNRGSDEFQALEIVATAVQTAAVLLNSSATGW